MNAEDIPTGENNLSYRAFRMLFERVGETPPPISIRIVNGIPLERGLGGSGSAILGGLLAANAWVSERLSDEDLLDMATELDKHPDNVAASLYGGLRVACWDGARVRTLPVACSDDLQIVLAVPDVRVATSEARKVLPESVPFRDAVFNVGRVALLVSALATVHYSYLRTGMEDRLHQNYRESLIPQMQQVFDAALSAGAWSAALSGSGPTIAAFCTGRADVIGDAMKKSFADAGISATIHITTVDFRGACTSLPQ
jgi:homoserine kinase